MECTQRLECTQELYNSQCDKICAEQIGFLGICGTQYAVKKGPNKIGRDPQTCDIVLNLNSISRQHAVINILNGSNFMLMDLGSANKTKLNGKTLQAYLPNPLKNGDTVQFGDVFGMFRLLDEDNDLPMTQAIDIPETPITNKHASRLRAQTVPESPEVSDKDDSFIVPSQPKQNKFKTPNAKYIKQSSNIIAIQPIGSSKIDNVFWNSSKKSTSFNLESDESSSSLNDSAISLKCGKQDMDDLHEMETQMPALNADENKDSIHTAETQAPVSISSPGIHFLDTQLPDPKLDNLPKVQRMDDQQNLEFNLFTSNKENVNSIFNADTQYFESQMGKKSYINIYEANTQLPTSGKSDGDVDAETNDIFDADTQMVNIEKKNGLSKLNSSKGDIFEAETQMVNVKDKCASTSKTDCDNDDVLNKSDEIILFDDLDSQTFVDDFSSQPLLPNDPSNSEEKDIEINLSQNIREPVEVNVSPAKRNVRINSEGSTDCEDIHMLSTQKVPVIKKPNDDEDLTDCEDDLFADDFKDNDKKETAVEKPQLDFEDLATQVIDLDVIDGKSTSTTINQIQQEEIEFEDLPTQVLPNEVETNTHIEDLPTQVLPQAIPKKVVYKETTANNNSPFKIPLQTPIKTKRKEIVKLPETNAKPKPVEPIKSPQKAIDDENYYAATQEIFDDLCTQREQMSPNRVDERNKSPQNFILDKSSESDGEDRVEKFVTSLSSQGIRDVIGLEEGVAPLKKVPSDPSDTETTPKKVRPFQMTLMDFPNSQEIKVGVSTNNHSLVTESSSESEENDSQESQSTPILFHRKKKKVIQAKIDLTKRFDFAKLPERVITRVRKPTAKLAEADEATKKKANKLLRTKYLTEQEDDIDNEIVKENITRLKHKNEKRVDVKSEAETSKIDDKDSLKIGIKIKKESTKEKSSKSKSSNKDKSSKPEVKKEKSESKSSNNDKEKVEVKDGKRLSRRSNNTPKPGNLNDSKPAVKKEFRIRGKGSEPQKTDESELEISDVRTTRLKSKSTEEKKTETNESKTRNRAADESSSSHRTDSTKCKSSRSKTKHETPTEEKQVKRKRGRPKKEKEDKRENDEDKNSTGESEVRRSGRKRPETKPLEKSTVYNMSSDSSANESSRSLKRTLTTHIEAPKAKRSRATPARQGRTQYVLFTAFPSEEVKDQLEKLGAVTVSEPSQCSVVVTLQIKRTLKLLCCVGLGRPVVGPAWVQACVDNRTLVDPWLYILKDEQTEKRFKFDLQRTLAGERNFLKGYYVSSTPKVLPNEQEMQLIVECSGGVWRGGGGDRGGVAGGRWVCVSGVADRALWPALRKKGASIVSSEFILSGVLRQEIDIEGNLLV